MSNVKEYQVSRLDFSVSQIFISSVEMSFVYSSNGRLPNVRIR